METNKILGAVILALLLLALFSKTGEMLVHPDFPDETAYKIDVPEEGSQSESSEEAIDPFEALGDIIPLLQTASLENGEKLSKKCSTCHSFNSGGANKAGPNMWNIVNRKKLKNMKKGKFLVIYKNKTLTLINKKDEYIFDMTKIKHQVCTMRHSFTFDYENKTYNFTDIRYQFMMYEICRKLNGSYKI